MARSRPVLPQLRFLRLRFLIALSAAPLCAGLSLSAACGPAAVVEQTVLVEVDGMVCGSCEQAITFELEKLDGVIASTVDHKSGRAEVRVDAGKVKPEQVRDAISGLGYKARLASS